MKDPLDFSGKVALVTGSSRGIGAETIKAFGERNAKCVVNYVADPEGKNKADAENVAQNFCWEILRKSSYCLPKFPVLCNLNTSRFHNFH